MIRKIFNWIFRKELDKLYSDIAKAEIALEKVNKQYAVFNNILSNIDVSIDVHEYHRRSNSWAVISLQGKKTDYIKFIDLDDADINHIAQFLRQFERNCNVKVDASPMASQFLKIQNRRYL